MTDVVIRGAREHNLAGIDLRLPGRGLIAVAGVSGSGKSSLVFDTLHAEGRRRYVEALDLAATGLRRPAVDRIEGLPPTIALRQGERAPGPHETIGGLTQLDALLGVVFARAGVQHDPETGEAIRPTPHDRILQDLLSLPDGARVLIEAPLLPSADAPLGPIVDEIRRAGFSRLRLHGEVVRIDEVTPSARRDPGLRIVVDRLKIGADRRPRLAEALRLAGAVGRGVIVAHLDDGERTYVDRPFNPATGSTFPELRPGLFAWRGPGRCPACAGLGRSDGATCAACGGARLAPAVRHVRYRGTPFPDALAWPVARLAQALADPDPDPAVEIALGDIRGRLSRLIALELGDLPLDRRAVELSRGEAQRLRLARAVVQDLSGVLYLLDEPTAGLAPELVPAVLDVLRGLCDRGSAVVVVTHRLEEILAADHVVELGPGAGVDGGRVVFEGPPAALAGSPTPSGRWASGSLPEPERAPVAAGRIAVTARPPWGGEPVAVPVAARSVTVVTGPAGAGSSGLVAALEAAVAAGGAWAAAGIDRTLRVEAAKVGAARSLVATFVGAWDVLRELLAATTEASVRGYTASSFSLATAGGRCEACAGLGEVKVDLGLLPAAFVPCDVCDGRRFQQDLLDIRWKGRSAAELLDLTAEAAWRLLAGHPKLERQLRALVDVGLGYVPLGQPTSALSGGEGARLRLARELGRSGRGVDGALILLDGPTDGLHPLDARGVIGLLARLAERGATVVVATYDPLLVGAAAEVVRLPARPGGQPVDGLWVIGGATVE